MNFLRRDNRLWFDFPYFHGILLVIQVTAWVTMPSPERVNGEHLGEKMDSLPLVMAEVGAGYDNLAVEVHRLRMEFRQRVASWANRVHAIADNMATTTVEFGEAPYQVRVLLNDIVGRIHSDMISLYYRLHNLREEEISYGREYIVGEPYFGYRIRLDNPGDVWKDEHFTSWREKHPDEGPQEYPETLLREALERRGILASVRVDFYPCGDRGYVVINLL